MKIYNILLCVSLIAPSSAFAGNTFTIHSAIPGITSMAARSLVAQSIPTRLSVNDCRVQPTR